ncbi:hypothetical protein DM01DRAFT_1103494 [Hesseltinella vesiculosa]|uniref:Uncharacterized protein n=1 Tax=Hesseltinella vesiculosa TaxID=101127 RepID=A0A1X2GBL2_9FUNG|nr:hypothetical protein DM01DRAFT_1103494 [Hesseltinella vesiculosa]
MLEIHGKTVLVYCNEVAILNVELLLVECLSHCFPYRTRIPAWFSSSFEEWRVHVWPMTKSQIRMQLTVHRCCSSCQIRGSSSRALNLCCLHFFFCLIAAIPTLFLFFNSFFFTFFYCSFLFPRLSTETDSVPFLRLAVRHTTLRMFLQVKSCVCEIIQVHLFQPRSSFLRCLRELRF